MDEYDFRKIDRELERELRDKISPPKTKLIPIGEWNGSDMPGVVIDKDYTVWIETPNPEYDCEVIIS